MPANEPTPTMFIGSHFGEVLSSAGGVAALHTPKSQSMA